MVCKGHTGKFFMDVRLVFGVGLSITFAFLRYRFPVMPRYISNIGILVGVASIGWTAMLWWIPEASPLAKNSLPGFSITFGLKIYDVAAARRQYVFDYTTPENARVSLYISPNNFFEFTVAATNKDTRRRSRSATEGYQFISLCL
jgi:hypothetical protein